MEVRKNSQATYALFLIPAIAYWFLVFVDITEIWPLIDPDVLVFVDMRQLFLMFAAFLCSLFAWGFAVARKYHLAVILATWSPIAHGVVSVLLHA